MVGLRVTVEEIGLEAMTVMPSFLSYDESDVGMIIFFTRFENYSESDTGMIFLQVMKIIRKQTRAYFFTD